MVEKITIVVKVSKETGLKLTPAKEQQEGVKIKVEEIS